MRAKIQLINLTWFGAGAAALSMLTGCLSTGADLKAKEFSTLEAEGKDPATACQNALDRENPLIVEWPGTHKVELESLSKRQAVIVRLSGCKLEVLPRCEAVGVYQFASVTPSRDTLDIKDDADLFSKLPIGSQALRGELLSGRSLRLDYALVGQRRLESPVSATSGACEGATHYVESIMVGAYKMDSAAAAKAGADIDIGILQAGGHQSSSRGRNKSSGDVDACSAQKDITEDGLKEVGCGAPVKLGLAPL